MPLGLNRAQEIDQRAADTINRPRHHHVEAVPLELALAFNPGRGDLTRPGSAYAGVAEDLNYLPSSGCCDLREPGDLVFHGLPVCTDPNV